MVSFAALLARHLVRQGWNGTTFANHVGYNQSYLSKILRGQKPPPMQMVRSWATALGLSSVEEQELRLSALVAQAPSELVTLMMTLAQSQRPAVRDANLALDAESLRDILLREEDRSDLEQLLGRGRRRIGGKEGTLQNSSPSP